MVPLTIGDVDGTVTGISIDQDMSLNTQVVAPAVTAEILSTTTAELRFTPTVESGFSLAVTVTDNDVGESSELSVGVVVQAAASGSVKVRRNGEWVEARVWVRRNGEWVEARVWVRRNGVWV